MVCPEAIGTDTKRSEKYSMAEKNIRQDFSKLSFEQALAELEELVAKMEEGNLPLDQMIAYFEKGTKLTAFCRGKLDKLEKKIEVLTRDDGKEGEWDEFDESSERKNASLRSQHYTETDEDDEEVEEDNDARQDSLF